eukprot:687783-Prorocentrum_minimum.AAC.1
MRSLLICVEALDINNLGACTYHELQQVRAKKKYKHSAENLSLSATLSKKASMFRHVWWYDIVKVGQHVGRETNTRIINYTTYYTA